MATGYTSQLESMNYDVSRWLKESVIRAMGLCVTLRDESMTMNERQIAAALSKESESSDVKYHRDRRREATEHLAELKNRSAGVWKSHYEAEKARAKKDYAERKKEFDTKKALHERAMAEIKSLQAAAAAMPKDSVVAGTLRFAQEQLQTVLEGDFGHECYKEQILDSSYTLEKWKKGKIEAEERSILYHKEQLEKANVRSYDRVACYKEFVQFVDDQFDN